ncbi:hypothetical protein NL676_030200 [Syzygium grande]|nr:hypothetical protein NL676_030200 [Syzygium grande]
MHEGCRQQWEEEGAANSNSREKSSSRQVVEVAGDGEATGCWRWRGYRLRAKRRNVGTQVAGKKKTAAGFKRRAARLRLHALIPC